LEHFSIPVYSKKRDQEDPMDEEELRNMKIKEIVIERE